VCFLFVFLTSLVWFFLWLPEEVLTLLFLLHRENGDFSILMKDVLSAWKTDQLFTLISPIYCCISIVCFPCTKEDISTDSFCFAGVNGVNWVADEIVNGFSLLTRKRVVASLKRRSYMWVHN
jgi:hypothetical protein